MRRLRNYARPLFTYVVALFGLTSGFSFGANWRAVNVGLTSLDIRTLAMDPANPTTVYAAGVAEWSKTDTNGSFSAKGTFTQGTEGSYTLRVEIGGAFSKRRLLCGLEP